MLTSCGLRTETTISCPFFLAVPQCEAPCFKLVLLKENVISSVLWQRGRTVFTCRNPREEKKKKRNKVTLWRRNSWCAPLHQLCQTLLVFLPREGMAQAGWLWLWTKRPSIELQLLRSRSAGLRSCVTEPHFLWSVRSSLGTGLQQSYVFPAV